MRIHCEIHALVKVDPVEHCQRFYIWLQRKGVNAKRNTIARAIAEKVNLAYPGDKVVTFPATVVADTVYRHEKVVRILGNKALQVTRGIRSRSTMMYNAKHDSEKKRATNEDAIA